jgi:hypothetical protein
MSNVLRARLSYANVMSTIAVFAALGGGAYAAVKLPAGSVGRAQLKANAVTSAKVKNGTITASDLAPGVRAGSAVQGPKGDAGPAGPQGLRGDTGQTGAPGAAGTARAYGFVYADGMLERAKNVDAVHRIAGGVYCIALDQSIDRSTAVMIATPEFYGSATSFSNDGYDSNAIALVARVNVGCPAGEIKVVTGRQHFVNGALAGNQLADEAFFFMVG